ncbi:MAG: hypothetical protein M1131_00390 [Actinobacteria bacterium]|nr:hypothetical protein [Actinomycetota bacterium]
MIQVTKGSNLVGVQALTVFIVPHTHWDREWYLPFQRFRLKLVQTMDELLDLMDNDPSFSCFVLDGQMAMVEDYLEIRPNKRQLIEDLAKENRLELGPFYVLADEFLPSGETLITNLQMGIASAENFNEAMRIGYLPDMFGHTAQMPQILRLMGIDKAVVWRGVPKAVDKDRFWWVAPDGSSVLTIYLVNGYANGAFIPEDPRALIELATRIEDSQSNFLASSSFIVMAGNDHKKPERWLGRVVREANAIQELEAEPRYHFHITGISQLFQLENHPRPDSHGDGESLDPQNSPPSKLTVVEGELRSSARANVLMGTISNRMDVRIAAYEAERALEALAEPLCSLFLPRGDYPEVPLALAWKKLVINSAHDSICACSIDEVVDQVLVRYHEARQIAEGLCEQVLSRLSEHTPPGKLLLLNTSPRHRSGVIEAVVTGEWRTEQNEPDGKDLSIQLLEELPAPAESILDTNTAGVISLLEMISSNQLFEGMFLHSTKVRWVADEPLSSNDSPATTTNVLDISAEGQHQVSGTSSMPMDMPNSLNKGYVLVSVLLAPAALGDLDLDALRNEVASIVSQHPQTPVKIQLKGVPARRVLMRVEDVPGYGWRTLSMSDTSHPKGTKMEERVTLHRYGGRVVMSNNLITVEAGFPDGTFSIDSLGGLGRLLDSGDNGDTYNYCPPPHDHVVDSPESVSVNVLEEGPVRARVEVISTYNWPISIDKSTGKRVGSRKVPIGTELSVLAGEPWVRVRVSFINTNQDHRLRCIFPLPYPVTTSRAKTAFAIVERGLRSEGGGGEYPLATFPSSGFVNAGALTIVHQGCMEYELVEIEKKDGTEFANSLALTMLRSVGMLSTAANSLRAGPAGPSIELTGSKMLGRREFSYAVTTSAIDPYTMAEDVFLPLQIVYPKMRNLGDIEEELGEQYQIMHVEGAQVSRVHRVGGELEIRVFNPYPEGSTLTVMDGRGKELEGQVVNLRGMPLSPFKGSVSLRAFEICTIRLKEPPVSS